MRPAPARRSPQTRPASQRRPAVFGRPSANGHRRGGAAPSAARRPRRLRPRRGRPRVAPWPARGRRTDRKRAPPPRRPGISARVVVVLVFVFAVVLLFLVAGFGVVLLVTGVRV